MQAQKDFRNYEECLEALEENSSDAKIFVLVHKMDKVPEESREEVFRERTELIRSRSRSFDIFPYRTSIWDETLYKVGGVGMSPTVAATQRVVRLGRPLCTA